MQCATPTWRSAANVKQTVATWDFCHNCHNLVITRGKCWSYVVKTPNVVSLEARQPMTLGNCNSSVALNHKAALSHEAMMLLEMTTFDWRFNQPIFCKLCNAKNQKSWPSSESCLYITQNCSKKIHWDILYSAHIQNTKRNTCLKSARSPCKALELFHRSQNWSAMMNARRCPIQQGLGTTFGLLAKNTSSCSGWWRQEPDQSSFC